MQRLAEWTGEQWIPVQKKINGNYMGYNACMERLAAYENTGLEPEEIMDIMDGNMPTSWIPISEQQPKPGTKVMVSLNGAFCPLVAHLSEHGKWTMLQGCNGQIDISDKVVAWMPLPKPYKQDN